MDVNVNVKIEAVELVTAVSTLASAIVSARNIKEHEKTGVEAVHAAPAAPAANPVPLASAVPVTQPPAAASVPAPVNAAPAVPVAASVPAPVTTTTTAAPVVPVTGTPTTAAPVVPVASAPAYTLAQIMKAGASLMDAGKGEDLVALLNRYGIKAINQLPPAQYGAIATELRALGAQI